MQYFSHNTFARVLFTVFLIVAFSVMLPTEARAAILSVDFTPDPLFGASNFLPQDEVIGTVEVQNTDTIAHDIVTEAINVSDSDGFGAKLHLVITDGSSTFFDGSFGSFLSSGATTALGSIASVETKTFTYTVSFVDTDDNTYQGKTLGFDLCVGFAGGTSQCGDTVLGAEGTATGEGVNGGATGSGGGSIPGSGGGGGPIPTVSLELLNEQVLSGGGSGTVLVEWDTNLYSTSQVIYGLASGIYVLDLVEPYDNFYGYPSGTVETMTKVLHHAVEITGLNPGETYKYRVVSRASPPTISFERQFAMAKVPAPSADTPSGNGATSAGLASPNGNSANSASGSGSGSVSASGGAGSSVGQDFRMGGTKSDTQNAPSPSTESQLEEGAGEQAKAEEDAASNVAKITDSSLSNVALSLVGVPKWFTSNLNCTLYALLLFGTIFAVWKFIEFGYTNWSSVSESGLVYRRKIQFILSACILFGVSAAVFDWCLLSPFIVVSAIILLICIILKR